MDTLWKYSVSGVWGPQAILEESDSYGGPHCAYKDDNSVVFRVAVALVLLPLWVWEVRRAQPIFDKEFEQRLQSLQKANKIQPSALEKMMAVACSLCMLYNIYFKIESRTLIFLLNPCHFATVLLIYLGFTPFSKTNERVALASFGFFFGGWLGIIFRENEGMSQFYCLMYDIQHVFLAFGGAIVFSLSGKYDLRKWYTPKVILMGAACFSAYNRLVLMPISLMTWANLNHSLCGLHSDPAYELLNLGKWYWLVSEIYLTMAQFVG